jgi:CelD/BcsL family acetyltransferase involved in cellulose biosynthesis
MSINPTSEVDIEPKRLWQLGISIVKVRPATSSEWDEIWNECEYSTYFHSREWAEIWSKYTKRKMFLTPFLILFSDGKKALLPFSCLKKGGLAPIIMGTSRLYFSSPECTYGGWISAEKLSNNHALLLSNLIKKKFNNLTWRLNPYDSIAMKSRIRFSYEGETHAINLEKGFNVIASNMSKGHRSAVKQASRSGVTVRLASSIEDWLSYYQVYETSVDRWGNRLLGAEYTWDLFNEIFLRNSPNVELWLSIYLDKVISGALCFHSKKHFVYWHGASTGTYFNLRPVNLLLYEVIKKACETGYAWFDFNPSGGLEGVKAFKERFGAQSLSCPVVELKSRNVRTFAIERVNDVVGKVKKRTPSNASIPFLKNIFNV